MGKLVNLRTVRKQKARATARQVPVRDAASAEAERAHAAVELERRRLQGHRRDEPDA